jgi:hypothetical protein
MSYRFDKYRDCRHMWIVEEAGKHCKLCGGVVYDRSRRWL